MKSNKFALSGILAMGTLLGGMAASGFAAESPYTVCVINNFTRSLEITVDDSSTTIIPNQVVMWRTSDAQTVLAKYDANQNWPGQQALWLTESVDPIDARGALCVAENTWSLVERAGYITLEKYEGPVLTGPFAGK